MASSGSSAFYSLDLARLPDELYRPETPPEEWKKFVQCAGPEGFPAGSLSSMAPISTRTLVERTLVFPLYMLLNAAPFLLPPVLYAAFGKRGILGLVLLLGGAHILCKLLNPLRSVRRGQYVYTERNCQKYCSMKWVWPQALETAPTEPKIFCAIPHGLAPVGVVAYPFWSKLWGERLCRWTAAPVVLKLPFISYLLRMVGYVPAAAAEIRRVLTKRQESVGIVLDGIAGMFEAGECGAVRGRKAIAKIALTTGAPLVPVFCFGHSKLWKIATDPCGVLKRMSVALNVSVTPFFGRPCGLLPFGPPFRVPLLVAIGEPITTVKVESPSQEQIDEHHGRLLQGFQSVFEQHKAAYGWPDQQLRLV